MNAIVLANSSKTSERCLKSRQTKSCGCFVVQTGKKTARRDFGLKKENILGEDLSEQKTYFFLALALVHLVAKAPKSLMRFKRSVPPLVRL